MLSVVIPVYNEQESLLPLCKELSEALLGLLGGYEVIFVDDGSSDRSPEILAALAADDPDV